jgi:putative hydrolase of the HAD superfamily
VSTLRAVLFDLGGVVMGSPLHAIAHYERELGLPAGCVNRLVVATGARGAWSRLERGELGLDAFYPAFDAECAAAGHPLSARAMMERIAAAAQPRPRMLAAVRAIRARGLRTAALTNNWQGDGTRERDWLGAHFDVVVESAVEGLRKPDPRIYELTLSRLGVAAREVVFLDDIGRNLKPARELGMRTIKVDEPDAALAELSGLLGFPLDAP